MTRDASIADLLIQAKITNRFLAAQLKSSMKQQDLIKLLSTTDATTKEVAEVLDTTEATVRNALQRIKGRKKEEQNA